MKIKQDVKHLTHSTCAYSLFRRGTVQDVLWATELVAIFEDQRENMEISKILPSETYSLL